MKDDARMGDVYDDLDQHYQQRLSALEGGEDNAPAGLYSRFRDLTYDLLSVQRETAVRLRNGGRISDETLRKVQRELDLSEIQLKETARD